MDLKRLQKKHKLTKKELVKEMKDQADDILNLLNKTSDELGAAERINNLKDITLRNMKVMGIITEENKWDYLLVTYKSVVEQYWRERDLPIKERAIYSMSFTDQGLRDQQEETLKKFKDEARAATLKVKNFKQVVKDWWIQRAEESVAEHDHKANDKRK
tara:strand:- start:290 stop:766 length:477 start_codon:yes stop_codon:yes gene_type:complete